jgi:4-alpha-glucanotransferase
MSGQAGAPPDAFSETGQNWSFPTYNWDKMASDGFEWWRSRFHRLEDYFTSFRIDHILGFFRIWEIPLEYVEGLCGHFRPALPLTITEIESYDLTFSDLQTKPRIHCRHLAELFGNDMPDAISLYLSQIPSTGYWQLKPFCDTQRKIESLFQTLTAANSAQIKSGLFAIANEVLLLEDPYERGTYHPRISADKSFAYRDLPLDVQQSFDRLSAHFFYDRHNDFWRLTALNRLVPLTASTNMLICGEDLGMIPQPVHEVMNSLNILTLDLERAPKELGVEFTDLSRLPYETVCTTSTHDMPPLRVWWSEDLPRSERYYHTVLHGEGRVPSECTSDLARQILSNHLNSPAMLTVIPLQDWLSISDLLKHPDPVEERINIPANPRHYWRYRMHIPIEVLLKNHKFTDAIRELISESDR